MERMEGKYMEVTSAVLDGLDEGVREKKDLDAFQGPGWDDSMHRVATTGTRGYRI